MTIEVSSTGTRLPISRVRINGIARHVLRAEGVRNALLSIAFVSNRAIAQLNRRYLHHRRATDVISFAFVREAATDPVIGDIYIAIATARSNARVHGVGIREELIRLVVHGVLHVTGHDHPEGDARDMSPMWRRQERFVSRLAVGRRR